MKRSPLWWKVGSWGRWNAVYWSICHPQLRSETHNLQNKTCISILYFHLYLSIANSVTNAPLYYSNLYFFFPFISILNIVFVFHNLTITRLWLGTTGREWGSWWRRKKELGCSDLQGLRRRWPSSLCLRPRALFWAADLFIGNTLWGLLV